MNSRIRRIALGATVAASVGLFIGGGTADAYPVGPWKVQGPCAGKTKAQCPMSPSPDGLTWSWHGDAWNYDKTGHFVCMSSAIYCAPVMAAVRALPPIQIRP
ncbi:MAG TPA: hypothetical protein DIW80_20670 [Gordonia polyisoprenivorans]|nr:hypothetical protein [Gordonia polyisoprenivorans]